MSSSKFFDWIKQNFWITLVCLASVLLCLLFYGNSAAVTNAVNEYWQEQWDAYCINPAPAAYNYSNNIFSIENNNIGVDLDESKSNS